MMAAKNNLDLETYKLIKEAMSSCVTKEEFRKFLELKRRELNRKEKRD